MYLHASLTMVNGQQLPRKTVPLRQFQCLMAMPC